MFWIELISALIALLAMLCGTSAIIFYPVHWVMQRYVAPRHPRTSLIIELIAMAMIVLGVFCGYAVLALVKLDNDDLDHDCGGHDEATVDACAKEREERDQITVCQNADDPDRCFKEHGLTPEY